jgi:hypothetical protein
MAAVNPQEGWLAFKQSSKTWWFTVVYTLKQFALTFTLSLQISSWAQAPNLARAPFCSQSCSLRPFVVLEIESLFLKRPHKKLHVTANPIPNKHSRNSQLTLSVFQVWDNSIWFLGCRVVTNNLFLVSDDLESKERLNIELGANSLPSLTPDYN